VRGTSHGWWSKGGPREGTVTWARETRPYPHVLQHVPGDPRASSRAGPVDPAPPGEYSPSGVEGKRTVSKGTEPPEMGASAPEDPRTSSRARSVDPAPPGESSPSGVEGRRVVAQGTRPPGVCTSTLIAAQQEVSRAEIITSSQSEGGHAHSAPALRLAPLDLRSPLGALPTLVEKVFSMWVMLNAFGRW
jgi:hypothetical protein